MRRCVEFAQMAAVVAAGILTCVREDYRGYCQGLSWISHHSRAPHRLGRTFVSVGH